MGNIISNSTSSYFPDVSSDIINNHQDCKFNEELSIPILLQNSNDKMMITILEK